VASPTTWVLQPLPSALTLVAMMATVVAASSDRLMMKLLPALLLKRIRLLLLAETRAARWRRAC
jgi:hypothetical protein